jgi:hypothetical protein
MTTIPSSDPLTWADYFTKFNENNTEINKHTDLILDISSPSNDRFSKIKSLTGDQGDSILLYYSSVSSSIQFIHNITDIGSKTWSRDPVLVALNGFNRETAVPVIVEIDSIFETITIDTPTFTRLSSIDDKDLLDSTDAPDSNAQRFEHLPFLLLPPFLWETACKIEDKSPSSAFLTFSKSIDAFIEKYKDDDDLKVVTKRTCSNIYTFLWAASKGLINSIRTLPSVDDNNIETWSKLRHSQCLAKPIARLPPPIANNNHDIDKITQAIEMQSASLLASQSESSRKGFSKLDRSTKNLILNATSSNAEIASGSATEHCIDFYKQSSHGNARLHFIRTLKYAFKAQTDVSAGVITSIFNGGFTRSYDDSPSNFSTFSFPEKKIFSKHAITDCIILQLKETSGKGLTNDDVDAALKQGIEIPKSVDSMRYSIFNITAASKFFFGEFSLLSQALTKIHNHIVHNRTTYISIFAQDSMFIAKYLFAIDTRVNLWLESCEECQMRDEVDDDLINFSEILNQVRIRNFDYKLPPSIRKVVEKQPSPDKIGSGPPTKKGKFNSDTENTRIVNTGRIEDWIPDQDKYSSALRSSDALKSRPKLNDTIMCHRFHSKGYCFDNCNNKSSHIPSSSLDTKTKNEYKKWVDQLTK